MLMLAMYEHNLSDDDDDDEAAMMISLCICILEVTLIYYQSFFLISTLRYYGNNPLINIETFPTGS
jgi:hypothetical protein